MMERETQVLLEQDFVSFFSTENFKLTANSIVRVFIIVTIIAYKLDYVQYYPELNVHSENISDYCSLYCSDVVCSFINESSNLTDIHFCNTRTNTTIESLGLFIISIELLIVFVLFLWSSYPQNEIGTLFILFGGLCVMDIVCIVIIWSILPIDLVSIFPIQLVLIGTLVYLLCDLLQIVIDWQNKRHIPHDPIDNAHDIQSKLLQKPKYLLQAFKLSFLVVMMVGVGTVYSYTYFDSIGEFSEDCGVVDFNNFNCTITEKTINFDCWITIFPIIVCILSVLTIIKENRNVHSPEYY